MKSRVVAMLAGLALPVFAWMNAPALAGEKARAPAVAGLLEQIEEVKRLEYFTGLLEQASEPCRRMTRAVKDNNAYGYCMAEMMRPYARGSNCIAFVAEMVHRDPGYYCDNNGMISYESLETTDPAVSMTKEQLFEAATKTAEKYTNRYTVKFIAACTANNQNKQDVVACLEKYKEKLGEVLDLCLNMKIKGGSSGVLAFGRCVEYKLNFAGRSLNMPD